MSHQQKVDAICAQVRARPADRRLTIKKAHPGHTPHDLSYKDGAHPVFVDGLDEILAIDVEPATATVEGQVTLGRLCRAALDVGLLPKVVPEFETFTVAGLVNGLGIETSSHRHGVFPASLLALEVVLGNGEVITADRAHHFDLLSHLPGSYGTLGVVTQATLQLQRVSRFVRSRYRHFAERGHYVRAFADALAGHEFVEGFALARTSYVLVTSNYADADALPIFDAMAPGHPWYYQHAAEMARSDGEDLVPSYQYLFRHERSLLWLSGIVADLPLFSHTRWGRRLLDVRAKKQVGLNGFRGNLPFEIIERCLVNQDMGMRLSRLEEGLDWVDRNLGVYPLWNCPAGRGALELPFAASRRVPDHGETIVDIGIYGEPKVRGYRSSESLRALQQFVDVPSLWGVCYLSPDELRSVYDFESHEAIARKYHAADAFAPIESKIRFGGAANKAPIPGWRLLNLYYDVKARLSAD